MSAKDGPSEFGARVYFYGDGVILVKQTVKSKQGIYVIDGQKERFVDPGDDRLLGEVIRLAGAGKL